MRIGASVTLFCLMGAILAGCETDGSSWYPFTQTPPPTLTVEDPADVKYFPSDEPLHLALEHFNRGHYGIAARYFEDAVEKTPKDATAWVGLAASYDRIGRFDLADRAYAAAIRLTGPTVQILNNQGYSYLLRDDLRNARRKFLKAYELEPNNPTILNNLALLNSSGKFVRRTDDP
jgi:Flp pilus assembly protein TadD